MAVYTQYEITLVEFGSVHPRFLYNASSPGGGRVLWKDQYINARITARNCY